MNTIRILAIVLTIPFGAVAGETTFVGGARPWNFAPRSRESHLGMQLRGPNRDVAAGTTAYGGTAVIPGGPGYPIQSNSYAIGNWIQVEMTLGDGSEGPIMVENKQENSGDQQSASDVLGELIETFGTETQ